MAQHIRRQPLQIVCLSKRTFSSTPTVHRTLSTNPESLLPEGALQPPPYPYGAAQWYKQQDSGLYGGRVLQFGHNVSEKNEIKTLRTWYPNIQKKWLYSDALGRRIRVRVSTRVLRTIDKVGGLDQYLLGQGTARVKELGEWGWRLRWAVLHAESVRARLANEPQLREMLGIDAQQIMRPDYARQTASKELPKARRAPVVKATASRATRAPTRTRYIPKQKTAPTVHDHSHGDHSHPEPKKPATIFERIRSFVGNPLGSRR